MLAFLLTFIALLMAVSIYWYLTKYQANLKHFFPFYNKYSTFTTFFLRFYNYYFGYVTIKGSKYVKINDVNPIYFIFSKVNRYFEEINKNKYLTLDPTNEKKKTNKEYKKLINKIRYLIRLITKTSDDCDEKCDSEGNLPLDKTLEINNMATVVRAVFHKENKYYLQVALDECLHKLWII